jgi:hypothetical protein
MKKTNTLILLEKFCRERSIVVKYDKFFGRGGFCRLREQSYFIINNRLSNDAKEQIFIDGIKAMDITVADIPARLRDMLTVPNKETPRILHEI